MAMTILIAEDDADISNLLRLYLEREGYTVLEAADRVLMSVTDLQVLPRHTGGSCVALGAPTKFQFWSRSAAPNR